MPHLGHDPFEADRFIIHLRYRGCLVNPDRSSVFFLERASKLSRKGLNRRQIVSKRSFGEDRLLATGQSGSFVQSGDHIPRTGLFEGQFASCESQPAVCVADQFKMLKLWAEDRVQQGVLQTVVSISYSKLLS